MEIFVGFMYKSLALVADACHMLSDGLCLVIAFIAIQGKSIHLTPIHDLWTKNPHFGNLVERHLWTKKPHLFSEDNMKILFRFQVNNFVSKLIIITFPS